MPFKSVVADAAVRLIGYRFVFEEEPPVDGAIFIGAPHTSYFDFALMLMVAWKKGIPVRWLGKKQFFTHPFGVVVRAIGGIPVDREAPGGMAQALAEQLRQTPGAALILAPEGTRSKRDRWKSGFYRIAQDASLPVATGFVDSATRTLGLGPTIVPSGDVRADMDRLREFYAGKKGWRPGLESGVRISMEEQTAS